jgi:trimethylamine--corrinoid protein Co-methyltransferase
LRKAGLGIDMFTQDELRDIHYATVKVLAYTGLWVEDDEAMDVFASGGCIVDLQAHTVRIPAKATTCCSWTTSTRA